MSVVARFSQGSRDPCLLVFMPSRNPSPSVEGPVTHCQPQAMVKVMGHPSGMMSESRVSSLLLGHSLPCWI